MKKLTKCKKILNQTDNKYDLLSVEWDDEKEVFVAVASGPVEIVISKDGSNWSELKDEIPSRFPKRF